MDNTVMVILLIICGILIGAGIVTSLVMKKMKAPENALTISILLTCFFALIASGILVFLVSVNMMQDYVNIRRYTEYSLSGEDGTVLLIKEYASRESTGFEVYRADDTDNRLAEIPTDKYLPFLMGEYEAEWQDNTVTITYTFHRTEDTYQAKSVTVSLKDGTVSKAAVSDKDLRSAPNAKKPDPSAASAA